MQKQFLFFSNRFFDSNLLVLQRFYHQQSQLREREANDRVSYSNPICSPKVQRYVSDRTKDIADKNPFSRHIQKLNPFKHQHSKLGSTSHCINDEVIYANTSDEINQQLNENIHRQRNTIGNYNNYENEVYLRGNFNEKYPGDCKKNGTTTLKMEKKECEGSTSNHRDEQGLTEKFSLLSC